MYKCVYKHKVLSLYRNTLDGYSACNLMTSRSSAAPTTTQFSSGTFWIRNLARMFSVNTKWKWRSRFLQTVALPGNLCLIKSLPYEWHVPLHAWKFSTNSWLRLCLKYLSCMWIHVLYLPFVVTEDEQGLSCVYMASNVKSSHSASKHVRINLAI